MPGLEPSGNWNFVFEPDNLNRIASQALATYVARRRWFADKVKTLRSVRFIDWPASPDCSQPLVPCLIRVEFDDGVAVPYFLPVAIVTPDDAPEQAVITRLASPQGDGALVDAHVLPAASRLILDLVAGERSIAMRDGTIRGVRTASFDDVIGPLDSLGPIEPLELEQSHSSVRMGQRSLLKLLRKLEWGPSVELELGVYLSDQAHFTRIPRMAGALTYIPASSPEVAISLALLQQWVPSEATGWQHALASLAQTFAWLDAHPDLLPPPSAEDRPLLELAAAQPPPDVLRVVASYLPFAATLGQRTAELHQALAAATPDSGNGLAPRPLRSEDLKNLSSRVTTQVESALALLSRMQNRLGEPAAALARRVIEGRSRLLQILSDLSSQRPCGDRIRLHGDLHLGQLLVQDQDVVFLDFEGEPLRSISERRQPESSLKDVVGMLRSFDYAAQSALISHTAPHPASRDRLARWADAWQTWISSAFLREYLKQARGASFLPADHDLLTGLLRAFSLDKTAYELTYELGHRPDWAPIPLRGLISLIERQELAARPPRAAGD